MSELACIGEPISWLRLETFALAGGDTAVSTHLVACPACARCLTEITGSSVELPRLVIPVAPARTRWIRWLVPAMAAAVVLLVVIVRRPDPEQLEREDAVRVKGVGELIVGVVRERAGVIRDDVLTYAPGDRWKVVVTCPPAASAWVDVAVADAAGTDYPLAPTAIACGNRVVLPGAFAITGNQLNRICVRVAATEAPARRPIRPRDSDAACLTLAPE